MKTLAKLVTGSHLYGTNVEGSDIDQKAVFLPDLDSLLLNKIFRNSVSKLGDDDFERIPVNRFVFDMVNGQTYALELAFHPDLDLSTDFGKLVVDLRENALTDDVSSMVGYCVAQSAKYCEKGNRLNAVKNILALLKTKSGKLGDHYDSMRELEVNSKYLSFTEDETHKHLIVTGKKFPFSLSVDETAERLDTMKKKYGSRAVEASNFSGADMKALMHAVRVLYQAKEILTDRKLTLPFTGERQQFLLDIRNGKVPFEVIQSTLDKETEIVMELRNKATFQERALAKEKAEKLLLKFLYKQYGL